MPVTHQPSRPTSPAHPQTVDMGAVHQACRPIAAWWATFKNQPQHPDADALRRANARAHLLGPVPGHLGDALAYIVSGAPDLDMRHVEAAFERITAAARQPRLQPHDLDEPPAPTPTQLCLAGLAPPNQPARHPPRRRR